MAVGAIAATLHHHAYPGGLGNPDTLLADGQGAAPPDIGLQNFGDFVLDGILKRKVRVPLLTGDQCLPKEAQSQGSAHVYIFRVQTLRTPF